MRDEAEARFRQTEQDLQAHLDETQKKLTELRTGRGEGKGATAVITEQQRAAIDDLEHDMVDTRTKLRLRAVRPAARHLAAGNRAAPVRHRAGARAADAARHRARRWSAGRSERGPAHEKPHRRHSRGHRRARCSPAAGGSARAPNPASRRPSLPERWCFQGLAEKLQQAARVEITHAGQTLVITKGPEKWGLADRGGFPVQQDKLRELLTGLTELRLTEPRTSDPAQFSKLGVEDPQRAWLELQSAARAR